MHKYVYRHQSKKCKYITIPPTTHEMRYGAPYTSTAVAPNEPSGIGHGGYIDWTIFLLKYFWL